MLQSAAYAKTPEEFIDRLDEIRPREDLSSHSPSHPFPPTSSLSSRLYRGVQILGEDRCCDLG
eukprot:48572-Eustigmatos_ZCMA.PRE.1